jgi:hypothetical protein
LLKKIIQNSLSKIGYAIGLGLVRNTPTLRQEIETRAVASSADYVANNMFDAVMFLTHKELLDYTVARSNSNGLVLEFGVYKANTLNYLASLVSKRSPATTLWGFDSFEGLPNDWSGYIITKETFNLQGQLPKVAPNVKLVKGFFDRSIDEWLSQQGRPSEPISILHIDSDLYESCKVILDKLDDFIEPGTFILFDEYFNYPNWQNHEYLAFKEFCRSRSVQYKYRGFYEQKVLVEIVAKSNRLKTVKKAFR